MAGQPLLAGRGRRPEARLKICAGGGPVWIAAYLSTSPIGFNPVDGQGIRYRPGRFVNPDGARSRGGKLAAHPA
jgi:hypothetical protein